MGIRTRSSPGNLIALGVVGAELALAVSVIAVRANGSVGPPQARWATGAMAPRYALLSVLGMP